MFFTLTGTNSETTHYLLSYFSFLYSASFNKKKTGRTKNIWGVQWLDTHLVCKNVSQTLLVMPVTDSFKKHEQNIFVDKEDANVKRLDKRKTYQPK